MIVPAAFDDLVLMYNSATGAFASVSAEEFEAIAAVFDDPSAATQGMDVYALRIPHRSTTPGPVLPVVTEAHENDPHFLDGTAFTELLREE